MAKRRTIEVSDEVKLYLADLVDSCRAGGDSDGDVTWGATRGPNIRCDAALTEARRVREAIEANEINQAVLAALRLAELVTDTVVTRSMYEEFVLPLLTEEDPHRQKGRESAIKARQSRASAMQTRAIELKKQRIQKFPDETVKKRNKRIAETLQQEFGRRPSERTIHNYLNR